MFSTRGPDWPYWDAKVCWLIRTRFFMVNFSFQIAQGVLEECGAIHIQNFTGTSILPAHVEWGSEVAVASPIHRYRNEERRKTIFSKAIQGDVFIAMPPSPQWEPLGFSLLSCFSMLSYGLPSSTLTFGHVWPLHSSGWLWRTVELSRSKTDSMNFHLWRHKCEGLRSTS